MLPWDGTASLASVGIVIESPRGLGDKVANGWLSWGVPRFERNYTPRRHHLLNDEDCMKSTGARGSIWSTVAVIVGAVAVGTVVAGMLHEPQTDSIAIPGCDEVIQPEDTVRVNYAFVTEGDADISEVPWRFESKAQSMTDALIAALPTGATLEPDPFVPVFGFDAVEVRQSFDAEAEALGTVALGNRTGILTVTVALSAEPPGPCLAGFVDERSTQSDGTVLDIINDRKASRVVVSATDGTRIDVTADGVLTLEQVIDIALTPGLRAST